MGILTSMATQTTLRYALNLISCAHVVAKKRKAEVVAVEDLRRAYAYFLDEKRSVQFLKEQQGALIFEDAEEVGTRADTGAGASAEKNGTTATGAEMDTS